MCRTGITRQAKPRSRQVFRHLRFSGASFLNHDGLLSRRMEETWKGYPLFKRKRLLLLVFSFLFSYFLEAVAPFDINIRPEP